MHLAAGVELLKLPGLGLHDVSLFGFLFGTATVGDADRHLSLSLGRPVYPWKFFNNYHYEAVATVSGLWRVHRHVALLTESWALRLSYSGNLSSQFLFSGGVRLMWGRLAMDLGGILFLHPSFQLPAPFLEFTYHFG